MSADDQLDLNVSRETLQKLHLFEALVRKWSPKINLVAKSALDDLWNRHIKDSAQLGTLHEAKGKWVDLGSGGGFPALVVSILHPDQEIVCVESDKRKCAFLRTAARELGLTVTVHASRIEAIRPQQAQTLSARALAELDKLLGHAQQHLDHNGYALFMKGENWKKEVLSAQHKWSFSYDVIQSVTDSRAVILKLNNIKRK